MIPRRKTRQVVMGDNAHGFVKMGGDAPVSVQSMTAGYTHEIDACVAEIQKLDSYLKRIFGSPCAMTAGATAASAEAPAACSR